jgi:hypothetical protein
MTNLNITGRFAIFEDISSSGTQPELRAIGAPPDTGRIVTVKQVVNVNRSRAPIVADTGWMAWKAGLTGGGRLVYRKPPEWGRSPICGLAN